MSGKVNANSVLFNTGDGSANEALGLDETLSAAEAAYDADLAAGGSGDSVDVDLADPAAVENDPNAEPDGDPAEQDDAVDAPVDDAAADGSDDSVADADDDGLADDDAGTDDDEPESEHDRALRVAEESRLAAVYQMNKAQWERDQAIAAAQNTTPVAAPAPPQNETPMQAFDRFKAAGDKQNMQAVIAAVNSDAMLFSAKAAAAAELGDEEVQAQYEQAAHRANVLAESQRLSLIEHSSGAALQQAVAPYAADRERGELAASAHRVYEEGLFAEIDVAAHGDQIGQYLAANPHLFGDRSAPALDKAFEEAATVVLFGNTANMVKWMREQDAVAAPAAPVVQAKQTARTGGGGSGRRVPTTPSTGDDAEAKLVQESVKSRIPNANKVLFGH